MIFNFFKKPDIVTRIAPSPTGVMHIGTARTALFNYLFAKKNKGKFILRIEDTDTERSKKEYEEDIIQSLEWLGLKHDEFYRQSERLEIYKKYLDQLIFEDKAYLSKEEKGERSSVIRFRNPNIKIKFNDLIRGEIEFDTTELGDFVIAKSKEEPLYHLAVVVDDFEMDVTHILRGDDGISNTPRQILIQRAIGAKTPIYAHLPLILGTDKSKLSKRHGAVSLSEFKRQGYLKEAIINHLALLGWNPGTDQEIFSNKELIKQFKIKNISKSGAVFDLKKLNWFNKIYLNQLPKSQLLDEVKNKLSKFNPDSKIIENILPILLERIEKISDLDAMIETGDLDYYFEDPKNYQSQNLIWKKSDKEKTIKNLEEVLKLIYNQSKDFKNSEDLKSIVWNFAEQQGRGDVLWPIRYALTGKDKSPDPFVISAIIGKETTITRVENAIKKLKNEN